MLARDHRTRLGQLFATLIHNAKARLASSQSHPIALIRAAFGGALIGRAHSTQGPLPSAVSAARAAVGMTAIVPATDTEQCGTKRASAK